MSSDTAAADEAMESQLQEMAQRRAAEAEAAGGVLDKLEQAGGLLANEALHDPHWLLRDGEELSCLWHLPMTELLLRWVPPPQLVRAHLDVLGFAMPSMHSVHLPSCVSPCSNSCRPGVPRPLSRVAKKKTTAFFVPLHGLRSRPLRGTRAHAHIQWRLHDTAFGSHVGAREVDGRGAGGLHGTRHSSDVMVRASGEQLESIALARTDRCSDLGADFAMPPWRVRRWRPAQAGGRLTTTRAGGGVCGCVRQDVCRTGRAIAGGVGHRSCPHLCGPGSVALGPSFVSQCLPPPHIYRSMPRGGVCS